MNKVAVILGAGPGLGLALAKKFASEGYSVAIVSRNKERLLSIKKQIDGEIEVFAADVTKETKLKSAFEKIFKKFGKNIDVMIYNAGQFKMQGIQKLKTDDFVSAWESNCLGGFISSKLVLASMLRRKKGTIIFTGATASLRGSANFSGLAVGKFGLRALSQSIARELGPKGIHVAHVIIDGQILNQDYIKRYPDREPGSFLSPESIAEQYWQIHLQDPTAWTLEMDLRPSVEKF
ncbi:MAG: SDR family NAD(P)-dependent oxidoreductase [Thermodesulfobacteriota bacterium]